MQKKLYILSIGIILLATGIFGYQFSPSTSVARAVGPNLKLGPPLARNAFSVLAEAINPSVVNIFTETQPRFQNSGSDPVQQLLEQLFGGLPGDGRPGFQMPKSAPMKSLGSGFIIRKDGLILTNAHVVAKSDTIKVKLNQSDEEYIARVIGTDKKTDVALIKIDTQKPLVAAYLGSSSSLKTGDWVAAFGNPYGHTHSMTKGIVSAIGRNLDGLNIFPFIQTDASINPGNSGGPMVDLEGLVVGINTAIDGRAQGIGFAIPIDDVKKLLPQLEKNGKVDRGYLGVYMTELNEDIAKSLGLSKKQKGVLVSKVDPESPAHRAGVKAHDVITDFDGRKIKKPSELSSAVASRPSGTQSKMTVLRNGRTKNLSVRMGSLDQLVSRPNYGGRQKQKSTTSSLYKKWGFEVSETTGTSGQTEMIITEIKTKGPVYNQLMLGDIILDINKKQMSSLKQVESELLSSRKKSHLLRLNRKGQVLFKIINQ